MSAHIRASYCVEAFDAQSVSTGVYLYFDVVVLWSTYLDVFVFVALVGQFVVLYACPSYDFAEMDALYAFVGLP